MNDIERRAKQMCVCPTGCAFLILAEAAKLPPQAVAEPVVAVQIAAQALWETFFWKGTHDWTAATALAAGPRLLPFARAVIAQPAAAAWFAPLDRDAQEWIGPTGALPPPLVGEAELDSPPAEWERYAQKPIGGIVTSTDVGEMSSELATLAYGDGTDPAGPRRPDWERYVPWSEGDAIPAGFGSVSSALAALLYHAGDYELGAPPLVRYRLRASADLRVFEVEGPTTWRALCLVNPTPDKEGRLVPDWSAAAERWDAVHLTLGAILTADQVRVEGEEGWTELRFWEFEQTRWLRWRFTDIERLPDLTGFVDKPLVMPMVPALIPPTALD